jgi:Ser/Thr protein kinase RdoA (MazF antagonist)
MPVGVNGSAKTHGLDGTLVVPDWPPLTLNEVRGLLRYYPSLGTPAKLLSFSPRPFSAASVVATQNQQVFVKRHYWTVRDTIGLREEHRFMAHLRAKGAAVPQVFASRSGETAIKLGEWVYEVHETPRGADLYEDAISWTPFRSVSHAHSAGQALARLHRSSRGFEAPARKLRALVAGFTFFASQKPVEEFDRYVAARPALREYLRGRTCRDEALSLLAPFHSELLPLLPALPPLWTHNDFHSSNLLWSDVSAHARAVAVIDFGLCDRTNAVHDLAHAIERNIVGWLSLVDDPSRPEDVPVHRDHLLALLDGYEAECPLSREESLALAPMTALCHAEFALSETDYFLSVLHSEDKARMACEGYLVSHARWFRGPGRKLLDVVREWARTRGSSKQGTAPR